MPSIASVDPEVVTQAAPLVGEFILRFSDLDVAMTDLVTTVSIAGSHSGVRPLLHHIDLSTKSALVKSIVASWASKDAAVRLDMNRLAKAVTDLKTKRDTVAHGCFTAYRGRWFLSSLALNKILRRARPEDGAVALDDLPELITRTVETAELARRIEAAFAEYHRRQHATRKLPRNPLNS